MAGVFNAGAGFATYNWNVNGTGTSQTTARTTAGVYTVRVVDASGCKDTTSASLFINTKPNISIADTAICLGSPAHVFDAGAGYSSYTWIANGTGTAKTTSGTAAGAYTVRVVDANGCKDSASATLTVRALPVVTLNLDPNRVCIDYVSFAVQGGAPNGGIYSMAGNTITMFDPASAGKGKHPIKYTVTNGFGCVDFAVDTMKVDTLPIPTIQPILALCKDASAVQLNGRPNGGTWKIDNGAISNPAYFDPSLYPAGLHTVLYNYSDTNGCRASATTSVTENALPVPIISAPAEVCSNGNTIHLSASLSPGSWRADGLISLGYFAPATMSAGAHSIEYTYIDGNSCKGLASASITVNMKTTPVITSIADVCVNATGSAALVGTPSSGVWLLDASSNAGALSLGTMSTGNHTVKYIYTDAKSCVDTASDVFEIYDTNQVNLASAVAYCKGTNYTFVLPNLWLTYKWNNVAGSNSFTVSEGSQAVSVEVTDAKGCVTKDVSAAIENALPTPDLGNDIELCQGESATLDPGTSNKLTYSWSPTNQGMPAVVVSAAAVYKVLVTDVNGCSGSDSVEVIVHQLPKISLGGDTTLCDNDYDRIVIQASYAGVMKTLWSTYDANVDSIEIRLLGDYWIQATDSNGCVNKAAINVTRLCEDIVFTWPNVITPNSDGQNDFFTAINVNDLNYRSFVANLTDMSFAVYSRWGVKMFESKNVIPYWDGYFNAEPACAGVYYFVVTYTSREGKYHEVNGFVQIIR